MKTLTIYILDSAPGETVGEKAYGVIAEGFRGVGWHEKLTDPDDETVEDMVRRRYRLINSTSQETDGVKEWAVEILGDANDIHEYQKALEQLE